MRWPPVVGRVSSPLRTQRHSGTRDANLPRSHRSAPLTTGRPNPSLLSGQLRGMLGVYMTAVELTKQGLLVAVTSRNAAGADLLVTDRDCRKAWSVQVKTNTGLGRFCDGGERAKELDSGSHVYVFVYDITKSPEFYIVPSRVVAQYTRKRKGNAFPKSAAQPYKDRWRLFS